MDADHGPNYDYRLKLHEDVLDNLRKSRETGFTWNSFSGDYSSRSLVAGIPKLPESALSHDFSPVLTGMEKFIGDRIDDLIKEGISKPIIVADVGGMAGVSWCKLAKHFEEEAKTGRVVFVVSNIAFDPKKNLGQIGLVKDIRKQFLEEVIKEGLVQYIDAGCADLKAVKLNVHGSEIPLEGNIDIAHESESVTYHSQIPEDEIDVMGSLMSERGIYLCAQDYASDFAYPVRDNRRGENSRQRNQAIVIGRRRFRDNYGFMEVRNVEDGTNSGRLLNYYVLRGPKSNPVTL